MTTQDVFLTGGSKDDALYYNDSTGNFSDVSISTGIINPNLTMGATACDFNNDGWQDLFVTTGPNSANILCLNNNGINFSSISQDAGITHKAWSIAATCIDYNLDGLLDIYVGNYVETSSVTYDTAGNVNGFNHLCYPDFLYLNNGDSTFTEIANSVSIIDSGCSLANIAIDLDFDYDIDIYSVNDFGEFVEPNNYYQNTFPQLGFNERSESLGLDAQLYGMGVAASDYDFDGDLDLYLTNIGSNKFLQNNNGVFTNNANQLNVENTHAGSLFTTGWGTLMDDFNNDMYPDLFVSNGYIPAAAFIATSTTDPNKLYINDGNAGYTDFSPKSGVDDDGVGRGAASGDLDGDGDQDIIVSTLHHNNFYGNRHALVFLNSTPPHYNYIAIKLQGVLSNRDGIGARVHLYSGGKELIRFLDGGSSHASKSSSVLHFGLGTETAVDSVTVIWPGGNEQTEYTLSVNSQNTIVENIPADICQLPIRSSSRQPHPSTVILEWNCAFSNYSPYIIRGKNVNASAWIYLSAGISRSKKISNLPFDQKFVWQGRRACDSLGNNWSTPDTFSTACEAPDSIFTSNLSANSVKLNWTHAPAFYYRIVGKPLGSSYMVTINLPKSRSDLTVNSLSAGSSYLWTVQGVCHPSSNPIAYSGIIDTFTTLASSPSLKSARVSDDVSLAISPNPTKGNINIDLGMKKGEKIFLFDLLGKQLYTESIGDRMIHKMEIPGHIATGLYSLKVQFADGSTKSAMIKVYR